MIDRFSARMGRMPAAILPGCLGAVLLALTMGAAQAEPPIRNARDAACRDQARAQVLSAPDPMNLGMREIGRRIYASCMRGAVRRVGRAHHRYRRYHYRRRR